RNAYSGAMRIFAMQALAGQALTVYEDGQQLRDFVYVGDVARANVLVFEDPRADYQSFNVGGGRAIPVLEFARIVAERAGTGSEPRAVPRVTGEYRFGDTRHIVSDISKLRALGWTPQGSIEGNVDEYLAWAQRQPDFRNYADEAREYMKRVGTVRN
ncbi:MAG: NAD-dependent epimerase/dehydratase family protein, partial [Anaerolineales bacterium]